MTNTTLTQAQAAEELRAKMENLRTQLSSALEKVDLDDPNLRSTAALAATVGDALSAFETYYSSLSANTSLSQLALETRVMVLTQVLLGSGYLGDIDAFEAKSLDVFQKHLRNLSKRGGEGEQLAGVLQRLSSGIVAAPRVE